MKKWVCTVCGYVHEGEAAPEFCPICKAGSEKFKLQEGEMTWACEHEIGVAQGSPEDIMKDLRANFEGECSESECILPCLERLIEKDIRRLDYTMRKLLLKRQSMLQNSQNYLVNV